MLSLTPYDQSLLNGDQGAAAQMAMRILVTMAQVYGATALLDIESAHIDGCLYHGYSGLEFAQKLVDGGGQVIVPTTLNVGGMDLIHPEHFQGDKQDGVVASRLMELYVAMGCQPIFTCTPYQAMHRPPFGSQIAWAESNAIVFANSVLGARTNRYGDFIDICAALTGRAPATGLHLTENRRGHILFRLQNIPHSLLQDDSFFPVLGYFIGAKSQNKNPVIEGLLPETSEDQLKALGAAAASSGAVALFHVVGRTPEAPTQVEAFQGHSPETVISITLADLRQVREQLSTVKDGPIQVVALGSPHFSLAEFAQLLPLITVFPPHPQVEFIVCTNRFTLAHLQQRGWLTQLQTSGIKIIVDSCVVVAPMVKAQTGVLMTNSGKFAHYTPGNIGLQLVFGNLEECVLSAHHGLVQRKEDQWLSTEP